MSAGTIGGAPPRTRGKASVPPPLPPEGFRIDLLEVFPRLKWVVQQRWFQFAVILPNLALFALFLVAGIYGSPVGNRNIIIVFVWILWWVLLISLMVPFASRVWCMVCPFPFFGEWIQRGSLTTPRVGKTVGRNRFFGWNLRWPKALSNIWLQNVGFLALCTFSVFFLTRPIVSVLVLGSLFVIATILHLIYRQRAFCNYVCPVSGFLSLYAMTSMLEVRSRDPVVCAKCTDKGCLAGGERGWGCPWFMYPSKMDRNNYCGLCMECVKTCPHDNMTLRLRPFCGDTRIKGYDEAYKAFIMIAICLMYSVIYLGPWAQLKDFANFTQSGARLGFLGYVVALWATALVAIPGLHYLAVRLGRRLAGPTTATQRDIFLGLAYPLVPLGLLAWVAFSLPLLFVNGSYILMTLSDPFGWGWDLFGTAHVPWTPVVPDLVRFVQVPLLIFGLAYALRTGYRHALKFWPARRAILGFAPVALVLATMVVVFLWLYTG